MRPSHIIVLIIVLILIFGARKLPDIAKSIGQSFKVLKKEVSELQDTPAAVPPALPVSPVAAAPAPEVVANLAPEPPPTGGLQVSDPRDLR